MADDEASNVPASAGTSHFEGRAGHEYLARDNRRTIRFFRIVLPLVIWGYRPRWYGVEHVPATDGVLFCPNHSSYMDMFVQFPGQPRAIRFMAKSSLFRNPILRFVLFAGGAFPIRRGQGDDGALSLAVEMLRAGEPLVVYPEGTRYRTSDELGPARRGAARIALAGRVPVVPMATYGLKPRAAIGRRRWWPLLGRATTIFGEPMTFDDLGDTPDDIAAARDRIWTEVNRLYDLARDLDRRPRRPRRWTVPPRAT